MPRAKPTQPTKPVAKQAKVEPHLDPSPQAVLHREKDEPTLRKWVENFANLLPTQLSEPDEIDLTAIGAGMSVWQRNTLLALLLKYCT